MKPTLTIIFLFVSICCLSQMNRSVVSKNGLNLRTKPDSNAEIIMTIPFLADVNLIDKPDVPSDTLSRFEWYSNQKGPYRRFIIGDWQKVVYKTDTGYVNDAYLNWIRAEDRPDSINTSYGITYPGANCFDNIHRNKYIEWKGLFQTESGYEIRDIQVNYYHDRGELTGYSTQVDSTKNLLICLGSDNDTFFNGPVQGTYYDFGDRLIFQYEQAPYESKFGFFHVEEVDGRPQLFLRDGDNMQRLIDQLPVKLIWKGDLDSDGKDDFIINAGDKSGGTYLYLSSKAESNQIVKPVAVYNFGYCC